MDCAYIHFILARSIVRRGTICVEGGYQFCHDPRLLFKTKMVYREEDVLSFLKRIRCPVLLVWASSTINRYKLRSNSDNPKETSLPSESEVKAQIVNGKPDEVENQHEKEIVKDLEEAPQESNTSGSPNIPKIKFKGPAAKFFGDKEKPSTVKMNISIIQKRMNSIAHLTTKVVEGHHHVHSDHPDRVFPHVIGFLKKPQSML